ncbi:Lrp/AsnC family transcriptional regulator [Psychromicrobium xiongbiense]|uniref:Lrp/AsnC family transcriptional regulator n=1 Tax=Psychromicrobium xiongbiense TaxID=3051184 RepID=UPI0025523EA4|nr:Lrp/AsnC family transcriptional regulator [Psychromicrobium sp. YIM S02556]
MRTLDATDRRLLAALSRDSSRPAIALAAELGLSRNTVQARIAALEHRGVFRSFEHRISTESLGYPLTAFISIHVDQRLLGVLAGELATIPEILEVFGLTGSADLLARVVSKDAEDLFRINGKILACDGVQRTDTSLAMSRLVPYRVMPLLEASAE